MKKFLLIIFVTFFILSSGALVAHSLSQNEIVVFNTNSLKVHKVYCKWAKKCTVNCVNTTRKNAYSRGGIPCKVCGG